MRVLTKAILFILILLCMGLPILPDSEFLFLTVLTFILASGDFRNPSRTRFTLGAGLVLLLVALKFALPRPAIQEGHQYYLPSSQTQAIFSQNLPPVIYENLKSSFEALYPEDQPEDQQCKKGQDGCWKNTTGPAELYAFSSDSFWQKPKYTRVVDSLRFTNLQELRPGFINQLDLNWYRTQVGQNIERNQTPFFIMLELNDTIVGSELCWKGTVYWPGIVENRSDHSQCRVIEASDVGKKVHGLSLPPTYPLAMEFKPTPKLAAYLKLRSVLGIIAAVILLFVTIRPRISRWAYFLVFGLSLLKLLKGYHIGDLVGYPPLNGGDDGLIYVSYAQDMLQKITRGEWLQSLIAGERVFYFMPGMRYFRALEKLIFGDRFLAYLWALTLLPVFILWMLRTFGIQKRWQLLLMLLWFWGGWKKQVLIDFAWDLGVHAHWAILGFGEPLAYTLFIACTCFVLTGLRTLSGKPLLIGGFIGGLAVFIRPNLAIAYGLFIIGSTGYLLSRRHFKAIILLGLGCISSLFALIHNLVYGGKFVLFTTASAVNLQTSPKQYLSFKPEDVLQVKHQLSNWIGPSYRGLVLVVGILLLLRAIKKTGMQLPIILWCLTLAGLHLPLFIWLPDRRYALLAWMFTLCTLFVTKSSMKARPNMTAS